MQPSAVATGHAFLPFQFTHPCGRDSLHVTIDSRTRAGCDLSFFSRRPNSACFDSRTRVRCDGNVSMMKTAVISFRFAHRVRCDHGLERPERIFEDFDSRTRIGCDPNHPRLTRALLVSIRAPAKGATFSGKAGVTAGSIFRFAHRALV